MGRVILFGIDFLPYFALRSCQQATDVIVVEKNYQRGGDDHKNQLRQADFAKEGWVEVADEEKNNTTDERGQAADDGAE